MATEVTVKLYVADGDPVPTREDIEEEFDVTVLEFEEEEV